MDGKGAFMLKAADSTKCLGNSGEEEITERLSVREKVRRMQELIEKNQSSSEVSKSPVQPKKVIKDNWARQVSDHTENQDSNQLEVIGVSVEIVRQTFLDSGEGETTPDVNNACSMSRLVAATSTTTPPSKCTGQQPFLPKPLIEQPLTSVNDESYEKLTVQDLEEHDELNVCVHSSTEEGFVSSCGQTNTTVSIIPKPKSCKMNDELEGKNAAGGCKNDIIEPASETASLLAHNDEGADENEHEIPAMDKVMLEKNIDGDLKKAVSQMYSDHVLRSSSELNPEMADEQITSRVKKHNGLTILDARQSIEIGDLEGISKATEDALQEEIFLPIDTIKQYCGTVGSTASAANAAVSGENQVPTLSEEIKESFGQEEEDAISLLESVLEGQTGDINALEIGGCKRVEKTDPPFGNCSDTLIGRESKLMFVSKEDKEKSNVDILSQMKDDINEGNDIDSSISEGNMTAIWIPQSEATSQNDDAIYSNAAQGPVGTSTMTFSLTEHNIEKGENLGDKESLEMETDIQSTENSITDSLQAKSYAIEINESIEDKKESRVLPENLPFKRYETPENMNSRTITETNIGIMQQQSNERTVYPAFKDIAPNTPGTKSYIIGNQTQDSQTLTTTAEEDTREEEDGEDDFPATFLVNSDVKTEMFSHITSTKFNTCVGSHGHFDKFGGSLLIRKVSVEEGTFASESGQEDDQGAIDDQDEDEETEEMEALKERMGEILKWSDTECMSSESGEDYDEYENTTSNSEEDDDSSDASEEETENNLQMTLTKNVKSKLPTMTEKDFSAMMSEYRDVLDDAAIQRKKSLKLSTGRKNSGSESETSDSGNEDEDYDFQTVKMYNEFNTESPEVLNQGTGKFTPSKQTCDGETSMEGTLKNPASEGFTTCDASTSMGEATLRAGIASLQSGNPLTPEGSTNTEQGAIGVSVGIGTDRDEHEHRKGCVTRDQSVSVSGEVEEVFDEAAEEESNPIQDAGSEADQPGIIDQTESIAKRLRLISQGIETSDKEFVTNVLSPLVAKKKHQQLGEVLADHVASMDTLKMLQEADMNEVNERLFSPTGDNGTSDKIQEDVGTALKSSAYEHDIQASRSEGAQISTSVLPKSMSVQVEDDMVRLRDEFLDTVKQKQSDEMTEDQLMLILSEYRENQKQMIERRLDDKRRADQRLQERLLQRKKRAMDAATAFITEGTSLEMSIRQMDEAFYGNLSQKFQTQSLTDNEINTLICDHVANVENFRFKIKMEVARRRKEAIGQWMNQKKKEADEHESDEVIARNLVMKQQEDLKLVKKLRSQERARLDEKLKAKLAAKRILRDSSA